MAEKVNLDAFIPREDFEFQENPSQTTNIATIGIRDLENKSFFLQCVEKTRLSERNK